MNKSYLHPDDVPPIKTTLLDELLHRQMAEVTGKLFYQALSPLTRMLLSHCHWYFQANTSPLVLIIISYEMESYSHVGDAIPQIVNRLKRFSNSSTIRIYPPSENHIYWEIGVDELNNGAD